MVLCTILSGSMRRICPRNLNLLLRIDVIKSKGGFEAISWISYFNMGVHFIQPWNFFFKSLRPSSARNSGSFAMKPGDNRFQFHSIVLITR